MGSKPSLSKTVLEETTNRYDTTRLRKKYKFVGLHWKYAGQLQCMQVTLSRASMGSVVEFQGD